MSGVSHVHLTDGPVTTYGSQARQVERPPMVHDLKCRRAQFQAVRRGEKLSEVRRMDRDYRVGDILCLREVTEPVEGPRPHYTGQAILRRITHILPGGEFGIDSLFGVLSIVPLDTPEE